EASTYVDPECVHPASHVLGGNLRLRFLSSWASPLRVEEKWPATSALHELQEACLYHTRMQRHLSFRGRVLQCAGLLCEMHEPNIVLTTDVLAPELTHFRDTRTRLGTEEGHPSVDGVSCPRCGSEDDGGLALLEAQHPIARLLSAPDRDARSRV